MEKKYVLVVEDSELLIKCMKEVFDAFLLENPSPNILYADFMSSEEAKKFINENKNIACLITDVQLEKNTSGMELATHFCKTIPNSPVYIITQTLPKKSFKVMDYPHVKHVPKPLCPENIEKIFKEVITQM